MAMSPGLRLVLVLLLSCGHLNSSPHESCPDFCTCQPSLQLNCSSAGLFVAPTNIDTSISELDLSNNQLRSLIFQSTYQNLHKLWLGNNSMPHLSLCVDMGLKGQSTSRLRRSCVLSAPTLQLLSVQRNQLQKLPQGLGQQRSLQVLIIAFNTISTLEQKDFFHLEQLEELDLQHNLISSLHPQIFEKLYRLKHLDLSFNLLTTIHPVTYMTLQHIGADVAIRGNPWICDCRMSFLQRQRVYGNSKSLKMWFIECASPLSLSVKNLQELDKERLDCQDSNIHQEVSVQRGSTTQLPCSKSDAVWWTPIGRATKGQQQGSLLISNITEPSEGLYVCLSTSLQILSSYYLHIHDPNNVQMHDQNRKIRSVSDKIIPSLQNKMQKIETRVSQSDFALAVSLSVIITFIVAFILGVFLQPYICACWQKNKTRKKKPQTNSVPNVQQEQYVNDAYLHCEDVDDIESHRERRVTFSEYAEEGNMQYYDAVAGDVQESNGAVKGPVQANFTKNIEFEIIQNSAERNSLSSQSSKSSISDNVFKENCSTPNTTQVIKEHIQKETPDVQINTTERSNEIPGFVSEPFADWSPHENTTIAHSDLDNGEPFEYSDSVQSGSPISPNSSFKQTNVNLKNIHKDTSFKSSSSSSVMSDSEPTHYTVNTDSEEEGEVFEKTVSIQSSSNTDIMTERNLTVETWPVVDLEYIPAIKRRLIFKTTYVDSYSTGIAKEKEWQLKQTYPIIEQNLSSIKKRKAPLPPQRKSSSSCSDNGKDRGEFKEEKVQVETRPDLKVVQLEQESPWPVANLERVCKVKRSLNFKVQNTALKSLPSSDSEDDRIYEEIIEQKPMGTKHVSGASSSSESDEEHEIKVVKQYQENTHQLTSPNMKSEECQLPVINLAKIPKVKQRLEIKEKQEWTHVKEKLQSTISFSREDELKTSEERDNYYENIQRVSSQKRQETQWPGIDLVQIPKVKRRLDLKTAKPAFHSSSSDSEEEHVYLNLQGNLPTGVDNVLTESDSSFSSDNEDDQQIQVIINIENTQPSTQESQWPMINLVRLPKVKRRLDLKTVKPAVRSASNDSDEEHIYEKVQGKLPLGVDNVLRESYSSFSSESEDDQKVEVTVNQETVQPATSLINLSKEIGHNQESQWPMINLVTLPKVKRRLDIRGRVDVVSKSKPQEMIYVPNPDSGTSSRESEDEQEIKEEYHQEKSQIITSPNTQSTGSQWPVINLAKIPSVKRRLDIKEKESIQATQRVPSAIVSVSKPEVGSSSSSESEDEVRKENLHETTSAVIPSAAIKPNQEPQWPEVNLLKVSKVKRRLDIKTIPAVDKSYSRDKGGQIIQTQEKVVTQVNVQKPHFETYSSSESEDEKEIENVTNLQQVAPPTTITGDRDTQWPEINLKIPKVRRRLDIKERVPEKGTKSPQMVTSPSIKVQKQASEMYDYENIQQVTTPNKEPTSTFESESQWPVINLVRVPKLKRRLDIKPRSNPYSTSTNVTMQFEHSSSSESEDEKEIIERKWENTLVTSQNLQPAQSEWPSLDLVKIPKLNRRLDFKERENAIVTVGQERVPSASNIIPKQDSGASSNDNELPTIDSRWPMIDLVRLPKLKRRLDVKDRIKLALGPSKLPYARVQVQQPESSSSSDSEEEQTIHVNQDNLQQSVTSTNKQQAQSQWPVIDLVNASKLKRRLDFKTTVLDLTSSNSQNEEVAWVQERLPSTKGTIPKTRLGTSSSSESEDETIQKLGSRVEPLTQWPVMDFGGNTQIKKRLDFKIKSQSPPLPVPSEGGLSDILVSSSSSIVRKSPQISAQRSPSQTSTGIPYISRRLDIKGPTITTSLNDSVSSSSDDEKDTPKPNGSVKSQDKHFIKVSPISTLTRSPTKTTPSIELEKYTVVTDKFRDNTSSGSSSPVVTPELQSKWAGMNLGVSRFRRRLDVTKPNDLPPSPPPSSPKPDTFFTAIGTERVPIVSTREPNEGGFSRGESEDDSKLGKSSKHEVDSVPPQVSLTSIPHVKRSLNITTKQKKLTSSSSNDEDTVGVGVPDLSRGVPQIKRRLHIKAPTPPPSSSSSDDGKVYAQKFSDVTDQRSIEYKRTIMKSTSYDSFSSNRDFYREPLYVESNRHTPKKLSLDNIKRKLIRSKQNELPPNLRWTSVGSHLSEHPLPTVRRQQDGYTSPTTVSLTPPIIKESVSDNSSSSEDEQNVSKASSIITQKTYSPRSVTFDTSPIILNAAPEDRVEQKGLSALKAMSSERKNWEYEDETFTESVPVSVDPPEVHNVYRRKVNINTKISQPQTYIIVSPGLDEMRRAEMLYGIPSNKRHTITSTELPEGPPPPVPSIPLPDESPNFAWRSPQSSLSRVSLGYVQRKTTEEESVDEPFYDNPNISSV